MNNRSENKNYIDLSKIINDGNSALLKKIPGLIVKLLAKIIRQDEMNDILTRHSNDLGKDFLVKMIQEFNLTLEIEGEDNLPENGKCFFAANHPFGIIDGLVLTHTVSQKYGTLKAIGNDSFMFIPQLRPLIAAVNVFGQSSKEYVKALEEIYNSETPITHFPSGEVSRRYNGKIQDAEWQKSFITKAISSKRDIVPFFFYGRNSRLFYATHKIRQILGIKLDLELMLLPREMLRKRNKTIKVKIGKPIPYQMLDKSMNPFEWAQKIRAHVYDLGKNKSTNINF